MKLQRQRSSKPAPQYHPPRGLRQRPSPSQSSNLEHLRQKQAEVGPGPDPVPRVPQRSLVQINPKTGLPLTSGQDSLSAKVVTVLRRILATVTMERSSSKPQRGTVSANQGSHTKPRIRPSWPQQNASKPGMDGVHGQHVRGRWASSNIQLPDQED